MVELTAVINRLVSFSFWLPCISDSCVLGQSVAARTWPGLGVTVVGAAEVRAPAAAVATGAVAGDDVRRNLADFPRTAFFWPRSIGVRRHTPTPATTVTGTLQNAGRSCNAA